jgi:hypothetical protein
MPTELSFFLHPWKEKEKLNHVYGKPNITM